MNVVEPLVRQANQRGEAVAIIEPTRRGDRAVTFGDLNQRSADLAASLTRRGVAPGDRVLVMIGVCIELYVALTALLRLGATAVFLDPSAGRSHVRLCCEACKPAALLGPPRAQLLRLLHPGLRRVRSLVHPSPPRRTPTGVDADALAPCEPGTPALLTFTSGSTATPKAAVRTHGLLAAQQAAVTNALNLQSTDVDLATLPVFVLANLAAGATTVIADADLRRPGFIDADPVLAQIDRCRVTRSAGSPAFYQRLAERCEQLGRTLAPLRRIDTGGAPVFPDLLDRLDALMPQGGPVTLYGSTEAEPIAHAAFAEVTDADRRAMSDGHGLLVGEPVPEMRLRIVDPRRPAVTLPANTPGEVLVTGDHVLKGYLDPADDAETKVKLDGAVWHRTGDAGRLDDAGRLWLLGRTSAVIADRRGLAYPFAIECAARQVTGVAIAALAAIDGRRVLAIQPASGADVSATIAAVRGRFADRVDAVVALPNVPLDARHNAKVRYPELREMLRNRPRRGS